jgi:hypothetical protein
MKFGSPVSASISDAGVTSLDFGETMSSIFAGAARVADLRGMTGFFGVRLVGDGIGETRGSETIILAYGAINAQYFDNRPLTANNGRLYNLFVHRTIIR